MTFERRRRGIIAVRENKREAAMSFGGLATEVQESESYVMDVSKLCVYRLESEPKGVVEKYPQHL